jgi:hypothetical protein
MVDVLYLLIKTMAVEVYNAPIDFWFYFFKQPYVVVPCFISCCYFCWEYSNYLNIQDICLIHEFFYWVSSTEVRLKNFIEFICIFNEEKGIKTNFPYNFLVKRRLFLIHYQDVNFCDAHNKRLTERTFISYFSYLTEINEKDTPLSYNFFCEKIGSPFLKEINDLRDKPLRVKKVVCESYDYKYGRMPRLEDEYYTIPRKPGNLLDEDLLNAFRRSNQRTYLFQFNKGLKGELYDKRFMNEFITYLSLDLFQNPDFCFFLYKKWFTTHFDKKIPIYFSNLTLYLEVKYLYKTNFVYNSSFITGIDQNYIYYFQKAPLWCDMKKTKIIYENTIDFIFYNQIIESFGFEFFDDSYRRSLQYYFSKNYADLHLISAVEDKEIKCKCSLLNKIKNG